MSNKPPLLYVPILHTHEETGRILHTLRRNGSVKGFSSEPDPERDDTIQQMWDGIYENILDMEIPVSSLCIYQDTLPVCGTERQIVRKLARRGSSNHRLLLRLMKRGARLEGTEDPDLLLQECDLLRRTRGLLTFSVSSHTKAIESYTAASLDLMEKRDEFIAQRIPSTLKEGEIPVIFMGVRHRLEQHLSTMFAVNYIIYRLPFRKVGDIYNV